MKMRVSLPVQKPSVGGADSHGHRAEQGADLENGDGKDVGPLAVEQRKDLAVQQQDGCLREKVADKVPTCQVPPTASSGLDQKPSRRGDPSL